MHLTHLLDRLYFVRHPLDRIAIRRRYSEPPTVTLPRRTGNVVLRLRAA